MMFFNFLETHAYVTFPLLVSIRLFIRWKWFNYLHQLCVAFLTEQLQINCTSICFFITSVPSSFVNFILMIVFKKFFLQQFFPGGISFLSILISLNYQMSYVFWIAPMCTLFVLIRVSFLCLFHLFFSVLLPSILIKGCKPNGISVTPNAGAMRDPQSLSQGSPLSHSLTYAKD